jgi:hypothetical protein
MSSGNKYLIFTFYYFLVANCIIVSIWYNVIKNIPLKHRSNQTILRYYLSFGEFMNNWLKFTVMITQTKQSQFRLHVVAWIFSCFVAIFPNWKGPGHSPKLMKKNSTEFSSNIDTSSHTKFQKIFFWSSKYYTCNYDNLNIANPYLMEHCGADLKIALWTVVNTDESMIPHMF